MDYKLIIAETLQDQIGDTLTTEEIYTLLEKPKSVDHGDVAFPTFSLAKVFRKAPQQIATDLGEKSAIQLLLK